MNILYGVQATGQGHISRARAIATELAEHDVSVNWLFSGRSRDKLFDMDLFANFQHRQGLSFAHSNGRIDYLATLRENKLLQFLRDVRQLDLSPYDLVVTDYEPVTAWAARLAGIRCIGIGHQYAFGQQTPVTGGSWWSQLIMRQFAPVDLPLGLHWHPYAANVMPPVLDLPALTPWDRGHILVYLPFENQDTVTKLLQALPSRRFIQYANGLTPGILGNVVRRPASINGFKVDLASCNSVICNSGFELVSECLQWGKPILTKPLAGQMEQESNALALRQLGYATVMLTLSTRAIEEWQATPVRLPFDGFSNVAAALAQWLAAGATGSVTELGRQLWQRETDQSKLPPGSPIDSPRVKVV